MFAGGAFITQFCGLGESCVPGLGWALPEKKSPGWSHSSFLCEKAYSADDATTFAALSHHVACTCTDLAAGDATDLGPVPAVCGPHLMACVEGIAKPLSWVGVLVIAAKGLRFETVARLEQVRAYLSTCLG